MVAQKKIRVTFCIPIMIIGGVETVFVNTLNELLINKNLEIKIISHGKITEPLYVDWLKSHPEIPVYVYYPLHDFFEGLQKYCRIFPLKQLRKIIYSLYKKYRRLLVRILHRYEDTDIFIDYKNLEFFKEFRQIKKPKIGWFHCAISYCENNHLFSRLPIYDKIVCITDDFLNEFKKKVPERSNDIVRIYNSVDPAAIQNKALSGQRSSEKYFCHVSRLADGKDLKTVFDAFEIFAQQHNDIKLFVVGDGPKASELKKYASKLKSAKQIVFWGSLDNPFGLMHGAIANILSSEHEGFGMVPVESMALAALIICSNYKCGAREILEDGQNGLLFDIGNAPMLAQCMSDALDNQLKEKKIQRAYKSLSRFSVNNTTKQITDLLQSFGGNK